MVALELRLRIPVVTVNVAEVAPAGTVADAGVVSRELVSDRVTVAPPAGAGWLNVTVQVLEEFGPRLPGLQLTVETNTVAVSVTAAVTEAPL